LAPDRVTKAGIPFHINTPDFVLAAIEFVNGTLVRLTTNFYVSQLSKQNGIELHGDKGSLFLSHWQHFDASVEFAEFGQTYHPVPLVKEGFKGTEWGRGILDMAEAINDNRPLRITGVQAAHVVDILYAVKTSVEEGRPVEVDSTFPQPAPMDW